MLYLLQTSPKLVTTISEQFYEVTDHAKKNQKMMNACRINYTSTKKNRKSASSTKLVSDQNILLNSPTTSIGYIHCKKRTSDQNCLMVKTWKNFKFVQSVYLESKKTSYTRSPLQRSTIISISKKDKDLNQGHKLLLLQTKKRWKKKKRKRKKTVI